MSLRFGQLPVNRQIDLSRAFVITLPFRLLKLLSLRHPKGNFLSKFFANELATLQLLTSSLWQLISFSDPFLTL
jgi:hypothetical protein